MAKDGSDIPPGNIIPLACTESLPSQYPGVSLSASTTVAVYLAVYLVAHRRTGTARHPLPPIPMLIQFRFLPPPRSLKTECTFSRNSSSQLSGTLRSPRGQCGFGYLAAVMIEGVPRKCGVSVLVRLHSPPLGIELLYRLISFSP